MPMRRIAVSAVLLVFWGCHRSQGPVAIRLVDLFSQAKIEGTPRGEAPPPSMVWDFSHPPAGTADPLQGWKAGPGISDLHVAGGRLVGRTTTAMPVLYVARPKLGAADDEFDSIELRIRASGGSNLSGVTAGEKPDLKQFTSALLPWNFQSPLVAGEDLHTLTVAPQRVTRMNWGTLVLHPTDAAGATFEIESIRVVSQRERRASIPTGVGWQGLGDIFHETIVSRSPEKFSLEVEVPRHAWLDLNVGSPEERPVTFKIAAVSGSTEQVLFERTVTTPRRWEPAAVDLSALAGHATLRFWLDVPEERAVGFWGSPAIRVHGARPVEARKAGAALGGIEPAQGVVLIMCDTLRRDHLPFYGYARNTAPNLARMASNGAVFLDNISQATWTKVATPSIMTSLYPTSHRVQDFADRLSASADTLARVYRAAGYATVSYSSIVFTGKFSNLQQGFEELNEGTSIHDEKYEAKTARHYVDRASAWIERHRDTPFFMYLHVADPHDPYEPRAPYDALWADPARKEEHTQQLEKLRKVIADPLMQRFGMPNRQEIQKAGLDPAGYVGYDQAWYDGSIRGMDAEIGRFLERLKEPGLEGKVQIVFMADHGEEFLEHGRMFHGQTVYGELADVPLAMYRPGAIPPGLRIKETVRSIDVMPTLLDLSGLAVPARAQGQSLVPLMAAMRDHAAPESKGWKAEPAVTEKAGILSGGGPPPRDSASLGLVFGGWKLVHYLKGGPEYELFDHTADPTDAHDVAGQHPEIVARLRAQLEGWRKMVESSKLPKGNTQEGISSKDLDKLRSLGYVQ